MYHLMSSLWCWSLKKRLFILTDLNRLESTSALMYLGENSDIRIAEMEEKKKKNMYFFFLVDLFLKSFLVKQGIQTCKTFFIHDLSENQLTKLIEIFSRDH